MGLLRRGTANGAPVAIEPDEDVYVVSRRAADHAVKAEKQKRKAAKADRLLAEAQRKALAGPHEAPEVADAKGKKKSKKEKKAEAGPEPVTGATVKRYIGIARIVVPVLAPIVYQAVGEARSRWDDRRARQLGVAPDQLVDFSGRGAALYARIHHLALSVRDLRTRRGEDRETVAFVEDAQSRLADLEAAVRSAEQMPAARRRSAHTAVGQELDRVETRLLAFWGVDGTRRPAGSLPAGGPVDR